MNTQYTPRTRRIFLLIVILMFILTACTQKTAPQDSNISMKGNQFTNSSSREGYEPIAIVNHISDGSMDSMDNWFTNPNNRVSSAHFGVSRAGEIHQYVDIHRMAWANGLSEEGILRAEAEIVRDRPKINPNLYTVSIEYEGTDGDLTKEQFEASVWLHRYIQSEVRRIWGKEIILDEQHVIGHNQIDPLRRPDDPGPKFPWERLYHVLKNGSSSPSTG
ncbi:hypothetical protein BVG16_26480 [Paenibacillus selenitireducens]|uniref:N-acetylmuramoyl-L-alanine amidase n=1 Tax=Paenibacillus selenitireducens TaxID=1324314 RepID=A0A1T2X268_9BACL|nr:N-acetylmuramoyl-L-alanine amidase [Paenibacillus selenitireducens]OPA73988.1 hypothetical protein BVG16_26480 [Paenibacillus selenitireducens]